MVIFRAFLFSAFLLGAYPFYSSPDTFTRQFEKLSLKKTAIITLPENSKDKIRIFDFNKPYILRNKTISHNFQINWSHFNNSFELNKLEFKGDFLADSNKFLANSKINLNIFNKNIEIENNKFQDNTEISFNQFKNTAKLRNNIFSGHISFNDNILEGPADFSGSKFLKNARFNWTLFKGPVDFSDITILGSMNFKGSVFYDKLDFSNIKKIKTKLNLAEAHPGTKDNIILINLTGSNLENILIDYEIFKLYFSPNTPHKAILSTYKQLLTQFKDRDMQESWKALYREYRDYDYTYNHQYFLNSFHSAWSDYGLEKQRILDFMFGLLFLSFLVNLIFFDKILKNGIEVPFLALDKSNEGREFKLLKIIKNIPAALFFTLYLFFAGIVKLGNNLDALIKGQNMLMATYVSICSLIGFAWLLFLIEYSIKGNIS